jgi:hypothetical protein
MGDGYRGWRWHWFRGLNWRDGPGQRSWSGGLDWKLGYPHRLAAIYLWFTLYPGIQDYCGNPGKAKLHHRNKEARDVELAVAKG